MEGIHKKKEIFIPKWAMSLLILWAEKAYRRGFQHGLLAANKNGWTHNNEGYKFRYNGGKPIRNAEEPLHNSSAISLETRHLEFDGIPKTTVSPFSVEDEKLVGYIISYEPLK